MRHVDAGFLSFRKIKGRREERRSCTGFDPADEHSAGVARHLGCIPFAPRVEHAELAPEPERGVAHGELRDLMVALSLEVGLHPDE